MLNRHVENVEYILEDAQWKASQRQHPVFDYIRVLTLDLTVSLFNASLFENKKSESDSSYGIMSHREIDSFLRGNGLFPLEKIKYLTDKD